MFFNNHNPTTLNRQGPDVGSQYRSVVFYHDDAQKESAVTAKRKLAEGGRWAERPIVTQIVPFTKVYIAEDYHQQYNEKRGRTHCHN
ncbi:MAG: peptide-methionine (S)-S-oxide reductase [Pirellulales bacterium]